MSEATQKITTPASGLPAIISYGVNLPALFRPGRPLTDSELVATWAVQKSARDAEEAAEDQRDLAHSRIALREANQRIAELAGDAEKAKADRTELEESRTALLDARQQIATLTRQVARLEKAAPQGEKAAPKTTTKGRRNGTRIEVIPESAPPA
jgi:phage-related minor tail protein